MTTGGDPVRYAVEYHDHARPADVAWIERLRDKYRGLPLDKARQVDWARSSGAGAGC